MLRVPTSMPSHQVRSCRGQYLVRRGVHSTTEREPLLRYCPLEQRSISAFLDIHLGCGNRCHELPGCEPALLRKQSHFSVRLLGENRVCLRRKRYKRTQRLLNLLSHHTELHSWRMTRCQDVFNRNNPVIHSHPA